MARAIKEGQSIYIPFLDGESVFDSQNRPRMYKTVEQFKKSYPGFRLEAPKLVEYAPVMYGRWEPIIDAYGNIEGWICACGRESKEMANYCPNCGAKMDGGQN